MLSESIYAQEFKTNSPRTIKFLKSKGLSFQEAEELTQRAWVQAWIKRGQFRGESSLLSWVNSIAFHYWLGSFRHKAMFPLEEVAEPVYSEPLDAKLDAHLILRALPLSEARRLWHVYALGNSAGGNTGRTRAYRARLTARKFLEKQGVVMAAPKVVARYDYWKPVVAALLKVEPGVISYHSVPPGESYAIFAQRLRTTLFVRADSKGFKWSITRVTTADPDAGVLKSLPTGSPGMMRIVRTSPTEPAPKPSSPTPSQPSKVVPISPMSLPTIPDCPGKADFTKAALELYSRDQIRDEAWEKLNDVDLPKLAEKIRQWDLAKSLVEPRLQKWLVEVGLDADRNYLPLLLVVHAMVLERIEQEDLRVADLENTIREIRAGKIK